MAAPTDAGRTGTNITTAADPWTVTMPASIAAGDLLVAAGRTGGAQTFNLPSGWNWLLQNDTSDASDDAVSVIWRSAAGSDTLSWDLSAAAKGATIVWRITGHGASNPEVSTIFGTGANCDPASITPSGGVLDYLVLSFASLDGETQTFTVNSPFTNLQQANSGTGGAAATNVRIAGSSFQGTAVSTVDPAAFTNAAPSNGWHAATIAIFPPLPPGPPHRRYRRAHRFLVAR